MATIILGGTNKTIETTISETEKINHLKRIKADPKTVLDINGVVVELKDIKYALYDNEKDKELIKEESNKKYEQDQKQVETSQHDEIKRYAKATLGEKVDFNLKVASFYCYAFTGKWLREWAEENDTVELNAYIREELKTQKLVARPKHYKRIFAVAEVKTPYGNLAPAEYSARYAPIKLMENYLSNVYFILKGL